MTQIENPKVHYLESKIEVCLLIQKGETFVKAPPIQSQK
jgi:hypothetical protein